MGSNFNRYRDEFELYVSLQPLRAFCGMVNAADAEPLSVEQLVKTTAQAQLTELKTNLLTLPKYQEGASYISNAESDFSVGRVEHWAPLQQTLRYKANKKQVEYGKAAIESGTITLEGVAEAIHNGWKVAALDFVNNTQDYFTERFSEEQINELKDACSAYQQVNYSDLPEGRMFKVMYRTMAAAIIQAYQDAGVINP